MKTTGMVSALFAQLCGGCAPAALSEPPIVVVIPIATSAPMPLPPPDEPSDPACPPRMTFIAGGNLRAGDRARVVADFCLDVTEVTAMEYGMCVEQGFCNPDEIECDDAWTYGKPELAQHPINCVAWSQAERYCHVRGKRLPTWEEWEWAAQGRDEQRRFVWGDSEPGPDQICWSRDASRTGTCAVGSHPTSRSAQGVEDLFGNVWEWLTPPIRGGAPNVARGASWQNDSLAMLEGENAGSFVPGFVRNDVVGFRCAYDGPRVAARAAAPEDPPLSDP